MLNNSKTDPKLYYIIGAACTALLFLVFCIFITWWICCFKRRKAIENSTASHPQSVNVSKDISQPKDVTGAPKPNSETKVNIGQVSTKISDLPKIEPKAADVIPTTVVPEQKITKSTTNTSGPVAYDQHAQNGKSQTVVGSKPDDGKSIVEEKNRANSPESEAKSETPGDQTKEEKVQEQRRRRRRRRRRRKRPPVTEETADANATEPPADDSDGKSEKPDDKPDDKTEEEKIKAKTRRRRRRKRDLLTNQKANPEVLAAARSSQEMFKNMRVLLSDLPRKRASAEQLEQVKQSISIEDHIRGKLTKSDERFRQKALERSMKANV